MADINSFVEKIRKAIYGKEVRGAFCDSLLAMNEEVEENREAESTRVSNENTRIANETARKSAENKRVDSETSRVSAEAIRKTQESDRQTAESERVSAENIRKSAEDIRNTKESERQSAENARVSDENLRISEENKRKSQEAERIEAENQRVLSEKARVSQETARKEAEDRRERNETARVNAESSRETKQSQMVAVFDEKIEEIDRAIAGQVVTDKTLSIEGQAADSKVTGERITALENRPVPENIVVDETLSNTGQAADAKVTGKRIGDLEERVFGVHERYYLMFDSPQDIPFNTETPFTAPDNGMFVLSFLYMGEKPTIPVHVFFANEKQSTSETPVETPGGEGPPPDESMSMPIGVQTITESQQAGTITIPASLGEQYVIAVFPPKSGIEMKLRFMPLRLSVTATA